MKSYQTFAILLLGCLYATAQKDDDCPPDIFTTTSGVITSPGWPSEYPHRWNCEWNITVPIGQFVNLQFTEMDLEASTNCNFDYVQITDDTAGWSLKYCGSKLPPLIISHSNRLTIRFVSDGSKAQVGFHGVYAAVRTPPSCGENDVQAFVAKGQTTVDVEILAGTTVNLSPGIHYVRVPTLNCTVKVIVNAASSSVQGCPETVSAIADSDSKLGVFSLSVGGYLYELTLPRGVYDYHYKVFDNDCQTTFNVFDSRLRRRLDFSADYNIKCSALQQSGSNSALIAVAEQKYPEIERLCRGRCKKSLTESVETRCVNDTTTITWPTDRLFGGETDVVPSNFIDMTSTSGSRSKTILSMFLYAKVPRVVYPLTDSDGLTVKEHLVPFCTENYVYDPKTNVCFVYQ